MNFTNLNIIDFEDLTSGNKYYIQKIQNDSNDTVPVEKYGIFDRFEYSDDNNKLYAVFTETYNFKNPITNEIINSNTGVGKYESFCHILQFIFNEPKIVQYNRKQNELLRTVIEKITNDKYMGEFVRLQCWVGLPQRK